MAFLHIFLALMMLTTPGITHTAPEALIRTIRLKNNRITVYANQQLDNYIQEAYFAHYGNDINLASLDYSIITMPFIMNIAPIVWYSGKTYTVPVMDEDLFHALESIRQTFRIFFPTNRWTGAIVPEKLIKNKVVPNKNISTLTLFSGGLDALYAVISNHQTPQLLVTVQGGDIPLTNTPMWRHVLQQNQEFALQNGHTNSVVASNFASFLDARKTHSLLPEAHNWWALTSQALTYCGLVAPIAFAHGCTTVLLGSTHTATYPFPLGTHPALDNAIKYAGIQAHHNGGDKTRTEKIVAIKKQCERYNIARPKLRVCWSKEPNGGNCSQCEKCLRTIMELFIIGEDPRNYGFNTTTQEAVEGARVLITDPKNQVPSTACHWLCIQQAYQEISNTKKITTLNPIIAAWCTWLCEQHIEKYIHNYAGRYTDDQTKTFTALWHNALKGAPL